MSKLPSDVSFPERPIRYHDRRQAGELLGRLLSKYYGDDVLVLGLPRGGVPVAYEVAKALRAPLDVFIVRKLGVPEHEELAMGAIASGGVCVLNPEIIEAWKVSEDNFEKIAYREHIELLRREREYRGQRSMPDVEGRIVIIVDDGLATGSTMKAAIKALGQMKPKKIVVAAPVGAVNTVKEMQEIVEEVVCPMTPENFFAVGYWYEDFAPTSDVEVHGLLQEAS